MHAKMLLHEDEAAGRSKTAHPAASPAVTSAVPTLPRNPGAVPSAVLRGKAPGCAERPGTRRGPVFTTPRVVRFTPGALLQLRAAVDERYDLGFPINRDYCLPCVHGDSARITDQRDIRTTVRTVREHLARLRSAHPGEEPVAVVGNGNLLQNFGFILWSSGQLFHLAGETVFSTLYTCLVAWKDGRVTVESCWFARENSHVDILRKVDSTVEDITDQVEFAASGQPLVRGGVPVPLAQEAELWYDIRHLLQLLCLRINGLMLYFPNAQLQPGLARKALCCPVEIRLELEVDERTVLPLTVAGWQRLASEKPEDLNAAGAFLKERDLLGEGESLNEEAVLHRVAKTIKQAFDDALDTAGYRLADGTRPLAEGEARFVDRHIEIFFRKAVYPHSVFVRCADGSCGFVLFPGKSGRKGTTLPRAQRFLTEELRVQDAILLDNGGDVRLSYRGHQVVPPSEKRPQIKGILAVMSPKADGIGNAVSIS